MGIVYILLTAILGLLGWIGNKLVNTLDKIQEDIAGIRVTVQDVSTSHDDLKERVDKLENHSYKLNGR